MPACPASSTFPLRRRGLTVIELLIAISIIGVLIAILLPAVQSSREAARKMRCVSNVKQLVLAATNYESSYRCYPLSGGPKGPSFFIGLLPEIEQLPLHKQFDLNRSMLDQGAAGLQRPAILACPSDSAAVSNRLLRSYGGNCGYYEPFTAATPNPIPWTGVISFFGEETVSSNEIRDGLSNTVMISEMASSSGTAYQRVRWNEKPTGKPLGRPAELIAMDCLAATTNYPASNASLWICGGVAITCYNHVLPPDSRRCNWSHPANSIHPEGSVTTGFCDGAVRSTSKSIDTLVWRAIGTRKGDEAASCP